MSYSCPLDWAIAAESKAGLAVDVLRVADVRAVIALIDGHVYPCSFGVRLQILKNQKKICEILQEKFYSARTQKAWYLF